MAAAAVTPPVLKSTSKTITDTLVGEHQHQIVGYSLIKGIGDGEPIASERFSVGGHEWVLLFYPDGKRSSSTEGPNHGAGDHAQFPAGLNAVLPRGPLPQAPVPPGAQQPVAAPAPVAEEALPADLAGDPDDNALMAALQAPNEALPHPRYPPGMQAAREMAAHMHAVAQAAQANRRDTTNEYAALFVALIGEGPNPQGVVNTSEGKVVRAFHRFTLVDQTGQGRDLTKGRMRDAGAVKISCARQDPNARNCHGYRKFVKRSILEDATKGFLMNDTIVIKYTIELVVSSGGALSRNTTGIAQKSELVRVPPPSIGADLGKLLQSGVGTDLEIQVQEEVFKVHKVIIQARSDFFNALCNTPMKGGHSSRLPITDIEPAVFKALLHFVYTDSLPDEHDGPNLEVPMAQHLLVAADMYQLTRLSRICEHRLCETVDVETVATTLALAHKNHAEELKKVCLDFVSKNLGTVMLTSGFKYMTTSCPELQGELLQVVAQAPGPSDRPLTGAGAGGGGGAGMGMGGGAAVLAGLHRQHPVVGLVRGRENAGAGGGEDERRVRPRRE